MELLKNTLKYIRRNALHIALFVLIGGAMLTLTFDYGAFSDTTVKFFTGKIAEITFYDLVAGLSIINISSWYFILISLVAVLLITVALSMELAMVEKHMRIGSKTWNGLWGKLNDNFLSTLCVVTILIAAYELWAVITCAVIYAVISIFQSLIVLQYVFTALVMGGMCFGLFYGVTMIYLWLPCLQITGFRYYESFKYAFQILSNVRSTILSGFIINVGAFGVIVTGMNFVCGYLLKNGVIAYAVAFIGFTYLFAVFTVGQEIAFFEADGLERADLIPSYKRR